MLADEVRVAFVIGVDGHGGVAEHRLGARGGDVDRECAVDAGVADVPEEAVPFLVFHLRVGERRA